MRMPLLVVALAAGLAAALVVPGVAVASGPQGSVRQVAGKDGCYTVDGSSGSGVGTCRNIRGGDGSTSILISPDGRSAYLVGYGNGTTVVPVLSVFRRDPRSGVLRQLTGKAACFSRDGSSEDGPGTCTKARDLDTGDAQSLAISADGRFLYVASQYTVSSSNIGGIAIFARSLRGGGLHQLKGKEGCVTATGSSLDGPGTCAVCRELDSVSNVHITPDQKYLYASVYDGQPHSGIAIFRRDSRNGTLHQLKGQDGCVTDNGTTGQSGLSHVCRAMPNIGAPWDIATPGNLFAYVPDKVDNLVQAFRRDRHGGLVALTGRHACVSDTGSSPLGPNTCVHGRGLFDVERAVLSANNRFLYTNSYLPPAPIAVLNLNPKTGALSQRSGTAACLSADGTSGDTAGPCRKGRGLSGGYAGVLAPSGRTLYFAEYSSGAMVIFGLSPKTGAISQLTGLLGCVSATGASNDGPGTCRKARALRGAYKVAVASGGRDIYVASYFGNGAAFFHAAG